MNIKTYEVIKVVDNITIDANPNKLVWQTVMAIEINESNNWKMTYHPKTKVKMCYDDNNIYLLYRVEDKYVISTEQKINGEVWKDSCVELFASPNELSGKPYFNLEINAGGTPLMSVQHEPRKDFVYLQEEEIKQVQIAHSLPSVISEENGNLVEWVIEVKIPFILLEKYFGCEKLIEGTKWRANFYKCAEKNSHPHWLSWNQIKSGQPDFHLPEYFGFLVFN